MINENQTSQKQITRLAIGLGLGLALTAALRYGYNYITDTDYKKLLSSEWATVKFGEHPIQIETPVELKNETKPIPEEAEGFIAKQELFAYQKGHGLTITLTIIEYKDDVYLDSGAVEQSVKNFKKSLNADNIGYNKRNITIDNIKGQQFDGSFNIAERQYDFSRVSVINGQIVKDLLVIVKMGDSDGLKLKDRIVNSLRIE